MSRIMDNNSFDRKTACYSPGLRLDSTQLPSVDHYKPVDPNRSMNALIRKKELVKIARENQVKSFPSIFFSEYNGSHYGVVYRLYLNGSTVGSRTTATCAGRKSDPSSRT